MQLPAWLPQRRDKGILDLNQAVAIMPLFEEFCWLHTSRKLDSTHFIISFLVRRSVSMVSQKRLVAFEQSNLRRITSTRAHWASAYHQISHPNPQGLECFLKHCSCSYTRSGVLFWAPPCNHRGLANETGVLRATHLRAQGW